MTRITICAAAKPDPNAAKSFRMTEQGARRDYGQRFWWRRWMLAPVVRGGAAGVRALLKRARGPGQGGSLAKAAERFLRRQVELEDASPFGATPAARAEHAARLSEAQVELREGWQARAAPICVGWP